MYMLYGNIERFKMLRNRFLKLCLLYLFYFLILKYKMLFNVN